MMDLQKALDDPIWKNHTVGDTYTMDGKPDLWKIAYYPLFGTYKGPEEERVWEEFDHPRALVEKPMKNGGIDFREIPLFYLTPTK